jgi:16S rRNA G966 N2-methylase RsmD
MNHAILHDDVRNYILEHIHENAGAFALRKHPFNNLSIQELAQQLVGLQKAQLKFPALFENSQIIYPPKENLEQTSSWTTAVYKAALINGCSMVDLTGGFGIDVSAFAKAYPQTTHVELNGTLQELAVQLFKAQGLNTKSVVANGMEFLAELAAPVDLIYLDPSRKTAAHAKAVMLEDYEPRIMDYLDLLFSKATTVMVKTSPMLDISAGLQSLKHVSEIHIVAVKNEVKELLWILKKNAATAQIIAVNLETTHPAMKLVLPLKTGLAPISPPLTYLYEPNTAVMKSMAFNDLCAQYLLAKLDQDAHLFTSDKLLDFPGRVFKINHVMPYKPKEVKKRYGASNSGVVTRNFRESVAQLRTKYKLAESETNYLFFTSIAGTYMVIEAVKM